MIAGDRRNEPGFGVVEILVVLVVVALAGAVLYGYMTTSVRTVEKFQQDRPLGHGRLSADQMTLGTVRTALQLYQAQHGRWPADKAAVLALLQGPPRFQCPGNDFDYDPGSGSLKLVVTDPARC